MFDSFSRLLMAYNDLEREDIGGYNWNTKIASGDNALAEQALLDAYVSSFVSEVNGYQDDGILYKSASDFGAILSNAMLTKLVDNYK